MASPSLKKMEEGGTQEGIYASSTASHVGEVDRTDLGLTLLPGSQIQKQCDQQGYPRLDRAHHERDCLKELNNGCRQGVASKFGECASRGKLHEDVCLQEKCRDCVGIEAGDRPDPERQETVHPPDCSSITTGDGAGDIARNEPHIVSIESNDLRCARCPNLYDLHVQETSEMCDCPVNLPVSEILSSAAGESNESRACEPAHGPVHSMEGGKVAFSKCSESEAGDSLDGLHPYERQQTEEYSPFSMFPDLQDALVQQLDFDADLLERGLSDENFGALLSATSGSSRSRSHSVVNDAVRIPSGTGSESQYQPSRLTSTPDLETRSPSLSTLRNSGISSGHPMPPSAHLEHSDKPLPTPLQTTRGSDLPTLSTENRAMSDSRPHDQPNFKASSAPITNLSETRHTRDSSMPHSKPKSTFDKESPLLERPPSTTALPLQDQPDPGSFSSASATGNSLSTLPMRQSDSVDALAAASLIKLSSAHDLFTDRVDKLNNEAIHRNTSLDNTADSNTIQGVDQLMETTLPDRIGPFASQGPYESPYAPNSRRLQHLLDSQREGRNSMPKSGHRNPMEPSNSELMMTEPVATPLSGSHHSHTATPIQSTTPSSNLTSQPMPPARSESTLPIPSSLGGCQEPARTGPPDRASSEQSSSESDETSTETSNEEPRAATERTPLPPALVNAARKGLHAITSVILNRIHHDDIVPRVISFIKTFPPSGASPTPHSEPCPTDSMDLLYKIHSLSMRNHSLLERNASLQRERDKFKRAAREWATMDPGSGLTKGQSMSREVRSLRKQLEKKTAEFERLWNTWADTEAAYTTSPQWTNTSPMPSGHEARVDVIWQDTQAFLGGYESRPFPTADPTPPVSKRVSVDLTESTPAPSWTLETPPPAQSRPLPSSPAAAALRSTMKRKTYSWLPDKANHMVKKPRPAARGSQPSTAIELDVEGSAFDADAELEAELERELLASQQVEERQRQRRQAAWARSHRMTPVQRAAKDQRAKAAKAAARTGRVGAERENLMVEEQQQQRIEDEGRQREVLQRMEDERRQREVEHRVEEQQHQREVAKRAKDEERRREVEERAEEERRQREVAKTAKDEERRREVEERARVEGMLLAADEQQWKEAEERTMDEELFGTEEEVFAEMADVQDDGAEGGWDEGAELALHRAMEGNGEDSGED